MLIELPEPWDLIAVIALLAAAVVVVAAVIVFAFRRFTRATQRAIDRAYQGMIFSLQPTPGTVEVEFHTYHGFVKSLEITKHHFWASPDDARTILARLNWFNVTWGMFTRGMAFIPLLSLGSYYVQRRRIKKQEQQLQEQASSSPQSGLPDS